MAPAFGLHGVEVVNVQADGNCAAWVAVHAARLGLPGFQSVPSDGPAAMRAWLGDRVDMAAAADPTDDLLRFLTQDLDYENPQGRSVCSVCEPVMHVWNVNVVVI